MFRLLILCAFFFSSLVANTSNIIIEDKSKYDTFKVFYEKYSSLVKIEDVSKEEFKKTISNKFTLGYNKDTLWLKFKIENNSLNEEFILSLNESFYEIANLYYFDTTWNKKSNGIFSLIEQREVKTNHLAFNLNIPKNSNKTFYLELKGKYAYFGNLELYEKSYFYFDNVININSLYIFTFGVISVIILFSLFLYKVTRETIYLYYVGYSFFNIIYLFNISGLLVYLDLQKYIYDLQLSASFMIGFLVLFSLEYLETKTYIPKYNIALKALSIPFFVFGILVVYSYQPWNMFINNLSGLICIILIILSIVIYLKGHSNSKYYLFAILYYFTFVVLFTFMVNGVFEYTYFNRYGFLVASILEVVIFSFMLATRYNEVKINLQKYLESEVEVRTNELTTLLEERGYLLKEINHRVKNNFHMILGMLWFENEKSGKLNELINRIKSMSMIHENLYNTDDFRNINVKEYLHKIVFNLLVSYKNIKLELKIDDINLQFDNVASLGVIVNEMITNSLKHNKNDGLIIKLNLNKKDENISLLISDNGSGFDFNDKKNGLGLNLIEQFCRKLPNAKYKFIFEEGTKLQVDFNEKV